ncbi:MAG: 4-vinyl reductase, partial [Thermoplasmata archaeon]|nr:4-vinyl reductase [Candidatus Sysuiplasma superficiale]
TLYEGVMASASHGLFFREGILTGSEIVKIAREEQGELLNTATKLLIARGWAEDVKFDDNRVIVHGSIEVGDSSQPTCHRLRGVFKRLYEAAEHEKFYCEELECQSQGSQSCVFTIKKVEE